MDEWLQKLGLHDLSKQNNKSSYEYYYMLEFSRLLSGDDFKAIFDEAHGKAVDFLDKHNNVFSESLLESISTSEIMKSTIRYYIMKKYRIKFAEDFEKSGYEKSEYKQGEWYQK